jgi:hypothetical protein
MEVLKKLAQVTLFVIATYFITYSLVDGAYVAFTSENLGWHRMFNPVVAITLTLIILLSVEAGRQYERSQEKSSKKENNSLLILVSRVLLVMVLMIILSLAVYFSMFSMSKTLSINPPSREQVVAKIKELPEVKEFLKLKFPKDNYPVVAIEDAKTSEKVWRVHVYEVVEDTATTGHTATMNWYNVDKLTGEIKCSFVIYENGKWIRVSEGNEYPCE